ncbi:MAG TPA: phosphoribosylaminoimidazolesuccinocarboxamide synthase [Bacteroidia bacterium]|nr:phosphoribosylaminoimidazolesuccinocarboxamide synthase [Bacteroidia bacterium]
MSDTIHSHPDAIRGTAFQFPGQSSFYKGKVRDVYTVDSKFLVMVVTDRISAFDVVLPRAIPFKGQVLNEIASFMLRSTEDLVPNWVLDVPDPNVTIGRMCTPYKVEMVIRGYLSGHAWREYKNGNRVLCGVRMPDGMKENDKFPKPIITPTTKASVGHDVDISAEEIIQQGIVSEKELEKLENYTRAVYQRGTELAAGRGLILVDTKYEFGKSGDQIYLIDEIHTPDSSRYFYAEGYAERQQKGEPQKQLSKEFVRQWLIENNFQGKEGQVVPEMSDLWVDQISRRYIELYEKLIGEEFVRQDTSDQLPRIERNILNSLSRLR